MRFLPLALAVVGCLSAQSATERFDEVDKHTRTVQKICDVKAPRPVYILETRAAEAIEQDLLFVDGLNVDRDIAVIICKSAFPKDAGPVRIVVRGFYRPKDGDWRPIDVFTDRPDVENADAEDRKLAGRDVVAPKVMQVVLNDPKIPAPMFDPILVIPTRRLPTHLDDQVRILVTINDTERAVDSTFRVDRFGLHASFFDSAMFVQRWGEGIANARGASPYVFDNVNFRPAPGINYGFTYYNRRSALLRFVEPGFGANLTFLSWDDRTKIAVSPAESTTVDPAVAPLQVGVGFMGSLFDNIVVATIGWNLNVQDQRTYFGVGISITGTARKLGRFLK